MHDNGNGCYCMLYALMLHTDETQAHAGASVVLLGYMGNEWNSHVQCCIASTSSGSHLTSHPACSITKSRSSNVCMT